MLKQNLYFKLMTTHVLWINILYRDKTVKGRLADSTGAESKESQQNTTFLIIVLNISSMQNKHIFRP